MDVARRAGVSDETPADLLQRHASQAPDRIAYTFLSYRGDGPPDASTLTYQELDRRARAIAAALEEAGAADQRVLLVDPPGLDYVAAFFGCLYGGAVAVPAYPPDPAHPERSLGRLVGILDDARPTVALAQRIVVESVRAIAARVPAAAALRWIATDQIDLDRAAAWAPRAPSGEDLAFLQYTSGSTGSPRGVMVRHRNLISNLNQTERRCELSVDSVIVSWLPPYHDMGLIGAILQVAKLGCRGILMSPVSFVQRPIRCCRRSRITGGPPATRPTSGTSCASAGSATSSDARSTCPAGRSPATRPSRSAPTRSAGSPTRSRARVSGPTR